MKQYIKNYIEYYNIGEQDIILCQIEDCGQQAVDIHHVTFKSQCGTDRVGNLIALCREHHDQAHSNKLTKDFLYAIIKNQTPICK